MDITTALAKARDMLVEFDLGDWGMQLDNAKKRMGMCMHTEKTISVSRYYINATNPEHFEQLMLHEIAHALDWVRNKEAHHGQSWKDIAASIGYTGKRTMPNPYMTPFAGSHRKFLDGNDLFDSAEPFAGWVAYGTRIITRDGTTGWITKVGRTRFHFLAENRPGEWTTHFQNARKHPEQTPPPARDPQMAGLVGAPTASAATSAPTRPATGLASMQPKGVDVVVQIPGRWMNTVGKIEKIGPKNYHLKVDGVAGVLVVPRTAVTLAH